jgi:hypothetical protein
VHVDHLDDVPERSGIGLTAGLERPFSLTDGPNRSFEQLFPLFEERALCSQGGGHDLWSSAEQGFDRIERQADEFQGDDLLENLQVLLAVDAIAGLASARFESGNPVSNAMTAI